MTDKKAPTSLYEFARQGGALNPPVAGSTATTLTDFAVETVLKREGDAVRVVSSRIVDAWRDAQDVKALQEALADVRERLKASQEACREFKLHYELTDKVDAMGQALAYLKPASKLWPVCVLRSRYGGVYEGAEWIAFNCLAEDVPGDAFGGDIECSVFFGLHIAKTQVGRGASPGAAFDDLVARHERGELLPTVWSSSF